MVEGDIDAPFEAASTTHEEEAARTIQRSWKRTKSITRFGWSQPFEKQYLFTACKMNFDGFEQPAAAKKEYKKYYFGPLPHLLQYLEEVRPSCTQMRKFIKCTLRWGNNQTRISEKSWSTCKSLSLTWQGRSTNNHRGIVFKDPSRKPWTLYGI